MDNKPTEKLGESFIKSRLLFYGFDIHSDLSYDKMGTDLIITQKLDDSKLQFIKIQCKSRRLKQTTNVRIPKIYVNQNFVLFVYIVDENNKEDLLCFFQEDFNIFQDGDSDYVLYINQSKIQKSLSMYSFDSTKATTLKLLFKRLKEKKYTSIIVDGIFLRESILSTRNFYSNLYSRELPLPLLNEIIRNIIQMYSRFEPNDNDISCYVYLSNFQPIDDCLQIDYKKNNFKYNETQNVKIFILHSNDMVAFQVIEDINRYNVINNLIIVANDIIYEDFLIELEQNVEEIIVMRLKIEDRPQQMYIKSKWGDISYPIGKSLGLEFFEL